MAEKKKIKRSLIIGLGGTGRDAVLFADKFAVSGALLTVDGLSITVAVELSVVLLHPITSITN